MGNSQAFTFDAISLTHLDINPTQIPDTQPMIQACFSAMLLRTAGMTTLAEPDLFLLAVLVEM